LPVEEAERKVISSELHEELGHGLVLLKLRVGLLAKNLGDDQRTAREECDGLSELIDQEIENVRRLSRELTPWLLEDLGLSAALRWLVGNYVGDRETELRLSVAHLDHLFSRNAQILLYRIVQEALTNVRKHAAATRVELSIERRGGDLVLRVQDDGAGFDREQLAVREAAQRGFGLATMGERAQMLGGWLHVASEEGKGTRLLLTVPVEKGRA